MGKLSENREQYVCVLKFPEAMNVLWLARLQIDTKVVPMKLPFQNPFTKQAVEVCFAGASTRRQGLYWYTQKSYNGSILGG